MLENRSSDAAPSASAPSFAQARAIAEEDAFCLDQGLWERWLALFTEDCEFWVPAFRSQDEVCDDPMTEVSHIYYDQRSALVDRVMRLTSGESVASSPRPRTLHHQSGFRPAADAPEGSARARCNWSTHFYLPHSRQQHVLFGEQIYDVVMIDDRPLIARKYVKVLNDFIPTMMDIYFL